MESCEATFMPAGPPATRPTMRLAANPSPRARASKASAASGAAAILAEVENLARAGVRTGASTRNWASYGEAVTAEGALTGWRRDLLTDPQTSGGLLIAVAPAHADAVLQLALSRGFAASRIVGRMRSGPAGVVVSNCE